MKSKNLLISAIATAVVLSACGSSDPAADAPAIATTAATTQTSAETEPSAAEAAPVTEAPAAPEAPAETEAPPETDAPPDTVVVNADDLASGGVLAVANADPDLGIFVAAVTAAGLLDTLNSNGPFTLFASTNAAIEGLPEGVVTKLLLPENAEVLKAIVSYHVIEGATRGADLTAGPLKSLEGNELAITTAGGVQVNGANVATVELEATNGIVLRVDQLLIPPNIDLATL
jgi:uncharacterized surface protein with fasciclin (FAS1) repeats